MVMVIHQLNATQSIGIVSNLNFYLIIEIELCKFDMGNSIVDAGPNDNNKNEFFSAIFFEFKFNSIIILIIHIFYDSLPLLTSNRCEIQLNR